MKNKKTLYYLIPAVILIWGIIVYKIITVTNYESVKHSSATSIPSINSQDTLPKEYQLLLNYKDPFLLEPAFRQNKVKSQSRNADLSATRQKPIKNVPQLNLMNIMYIGMVEKPGNHTIALINIGGETKMLRKGEHADQIKVLNIWTDSVQIFSNGEIYYLKK